LRRRYLAWFDTSKDWRGGHSYPGYVANFLRDTVGRLDDSEVLVLLRDADQLPRAASRAAERVNAQSDAACVPVLATLLESGEHPHLAREELIAALGRTGRTEAEAVLLRLYDQRPAERDSIIRALANYQNARNWPIFVRALDSPERDTVRSAVQALIGIEQKPDGPAPYRAAIEAGARLAERGGWDTVLLLRQWAGRHFGHKRRSEWKDELDKWQAWYAEQYPDAPSAKLAEAAKPTHDWTYDQLLAYLEGQGRNGSVEDGRKLFEKAVCAKCHRFEQIGTGLGPDLTTLAGRFKRKDILEATIYPSRVISDQYKSVVVATKDGRVITAMRAPDDGDNLVLLLSDASSLKLPKAEVEEIVDGKQSVMPDGLLNQLSLEEIADLFAFLESGKPTAPQDSTNQ
jgi:putative heme-binding domain-containing protein